MKIKSITIENFKSIEKININNLGDLNIFIGKNNAGKSAILEAINFENINFDPTQIHFGQDEARIELSYKAENIEKFLPTFKKEILDKIKGSYNQIIDPNSIKHELVHNKEKLVVKFSIITPVGRISRETTKRISGNSEENLHFIEKNIQIGKQQIYSRKGDPINITTDELPKSEYEQVMNAHIPLSEREDLITQVGIINGVLNQIKKDKIATIKIGANRKIPKEEGLINEIKDYINLPQNRSKKEKIMKYLKSIELSLYDIFTPLNEEIQFTYDKHPEFGINLNRFGSGIVQLIEIMYRILKIPYGIVLIEEPETNLHPEGQKILFEFLKEESKIKQIFLTTHSSIFINKSEFKNVYLIKKANYQTTIEEIKENDGYKILEDIGIKPSDILQSDFLVFVDGPSDKNILKQYIDIYDAPVNKLNFVILPFGGQNIEHINFEEIAKINRKFIVILDSDKKQESDTIKKSKADIKKNIEKGGNFCFLDENVREIENHFSKESIKKYYKIQKELEFGPFDDLEETIKELNQKYNLQIRYDKTRDGHKIVKEMKKEEISGEIKKIIEKIKEMGK